MFAVATVALMLLSGCGIECSSMKIVCIGDSLTACGGDGGRYTDWLNIWLPEHTIINKGIGGDTLAGGRQRFQSDVLELKPDIVVIELGANDFWQKNRPIEALEDDLEDMVKRAKAAGAEVVIAGCFGERDYTSENNVEYSPERYDFANAIAKMEGDICHRYGCFYIPNMQIDIKPNGRAPYWAEDNHPNKEGNQFVARRILSKLKEAIAAANLKNRYK